MSEPTDNEVERLARAIYAVLEEAAKDFEGDMNGLPTGEHVSDWIRHTLIPNMAQTLDLAMTTPDIDRAEMLRVFAEKVLEWAARQARDDHAQNGWGDYEMDEDLVAMTAELTRLSAPAAEPAESLAQPPAPDSGGECPECGGPLNDSGKCIEFHGTGRTPDHTPPTGLEPRGPIPGPGIYLHQEGCPCDTCTAYRKAYPAPAVPSAGETYPHVPAAFINAIREEGTKEEACDWLQKQWNELCVLRARPAERGELQKLVNFFTTEMADYGWRGNTKGWTPAETAVNAIRDLKALRALPPAEGEHK